VAGCFLNYVHHVNFKERAMKTVFITGAARGIGLAIARRYASQGWFVGLYDINTEALGALLDAGGFPHACAQYCDVTCNGSIAAALEHFSAHSGGRMDLLVNNAGVLSSGKFEELDPQQYERIVEVNIKGLTNVLYGAFPLLRQTPGATVVNLCSASSIHGLPLLAVYSASKFYVNGLTEALNIEWAEYDIRVTSIKPPVVDTSMGHQLNPRLVAKTGSHLSPESVAETVQRAARGGRSGYFVGARAIIWSLLDRLMPDFARRRLTRYLAGY
jgi:NAD(P)-dependent dehydrogenase (short-subunit alcohol dehydrogenase family)